VSDVRDGSRGSPDVQVSPRGREGLTGTTPTDLYRRSPERESVTIAPDSQLHDAQPAWRQDFPIDWPDDQYVERRDFMKFMVLTSLAFTTGQFWIGAQDWLRAGATRTGATLESGRRIASLDDVDIGSALPFSYPGEHDRCVLIRLGPSDLVAYSQKCTHLSCAVIPMPERGILRCPCHDGVFDLRSGRPTAGPPRRPLPRILLDLRGRDIYAVGVELRTT